MNIAIKLGTTPVTALNLPAYRATLYPSNQSHLFDRGSSQESGPTGAPVMICTILLPGSKCESTHLAELLATTA